MSDSIYCKKHGRDKRCLGGKSANYTNWYCPECDKDEELDHLRTQLQERDAQLAAIKYDNGLLLEVLKYPEHKAAFENLHLRRQVNERDAQLAECVLLLNAFSSPEYEPGGKVKDQGPLRLKARSFIQLLPATAKANAKIIEAAEVQEERIDADLSSYLYACAKTNEAVRAKKALKP